MSRCCPEFRKPRSRGLTAEDIESVKEALADKLYRAIPAGVGSTGKLHLNAEEMNAMLTGGAAWAVEQGYGLREDLERIEDHGQMKHAKPVEV
jgi:tRNA-splicing ligase RtcB